MLIETIQFQKAKSSTLSCVCSKKKLAPTLEHMHIHSPQSHFIIRLILSPSLTQSLTNSLPPSPPPFLPLSLPPSPSLWNSPLPLSLCTCTRTRVYMIHYITLHIIHSIILLKIFYSRGGNRSRDSRSRMKDSSCSNSSRRKRKRKRLGVCGGGRGWCPWQRRATPVTGYKPV